MRKHCIFEHFLRFVKQIRAKLWVIVTLQDFANMKLSALDEELELRWSLAHWFVILRLRLKKDFSKW